MQSLRDAAANGFYYAAGLMFLMLAKSKSRLAGYTDPKPFPIGQMDRCADYDIGIVERWLRELERYSGIAGSIVGKSVLEIGPGSDLGVGLSLLARGAQSYSAIDKFDLAASVPAEFYELLFGRLSRSQPPPKVEELRAALATATRDRSGPLCYLVRPDFDIAAVVPERSIDIVFSNAAFEHVENVERMMAQLSRVVKAGGMIVAEVDLRTHSRWIRDKDPNNIYRYSEWIYDRFQYAGRPNRIRPGQYRQYLQSNGWVAIEMNPASQLAPTLSHRNAHLATKFRGAENQMDYLTVTLCATKAP